MTTGVAERVPPRAVADADHEPSDADDRVVPLDDPAAREPPIDDDDRDPAVQERRRKASGQRPVAMSSYHGRGVRTHGAGVPWAIGIVKGWRQRSRGATTITTKTGGDMSNQETGDITGTKDKDYNLIWFVEACLSNALRMETYARDAERDGDNELAEFFRRAHGESRKGADQGKQLLRQRLSS
jgi:hypothetical protein